jgi:hypothetical protein
MTAAVVRACCGLAAAVKVEAMPGARPAAVTARAAAAMTAARLIVLELKLLNVLLASRWAGPHGGQ